MAPDVDRLSLACCCAAFVLPLSLFAFYEVTSTGDQHKNKKTAHVGAYVSFRHAVVGGPALDTIANVSDERGARAAT